MGIWKNVEELEESLCLEELELIIKKAREKEQREQKFMAALKGIDLDSSQEDNQERFEKVQKRAQAILQNKSADEVERDDFAELGLDIEVV